MNDLIMILVALLAGLVSGMLFFGGLWITVQKAMTAKQPAVWFGLSFILRLAITLPVFYFIAKEGWQSLLMAVAAFIIARTVVIKFAKSTRGKKLFEKEVPHEA